MLERLIQFVVCGRWEDCGRSRCERVSASFACVYDESDGRTAADPRCERVSASFACICVRLELMQSTVGTVHGTAQISLGVLEGREDPERITIDISKSLITSSLFGVYRQISKGNGSIWGRGTLSSRATA